MSPAEVILMRVTRLAESKECDRDEFDGILLDLQRRHLFRYHKGVSKELTRSPALRKKKP